MGFRTVALFFLLAFTILGLRDRLPEDTVACLLVGVVGGLFTIELVRMLVLIYRDYYVI